MAGETENENGKKGNKRNVEQTIDQGYFGRPIIPDGKTLLKVNPENRPT